MENLTPDQFVDIREKRRRMFEQMGVSQAGQMMTESAVSTGAKNMNILQKIQQIKSGAAKSELNKFVNATAKPGTMPGAQGFDPIPESRPNRNQNQRQNPNIPAQGVDPKNRVELQNFSGPSSRVDNSELSMIDNMFGGGPSRGSMSPQSMGFDNGQNFMQQRPQTMQLDLDSTLSQMPSFNPANAIQRAKTKALTNGHDGQYLQFAQGSPAGSPADYAVQDPNMNQQMANMGFTPQMKMMMETIARTMAEQTIRKVLSEFTENQKSKNTFEVYNKEKSIIKTSDGKLYKLTPVQVKR